MPKVLTCPRCRKPCFVPTAMLEQRITCLQCGEVIQEASAMPGPTSLDDSFTEWVLPPEDFESPRDLPVESHEVHDDHVELHPGKASPQHDPAPSLDRKSNSSLKRKLIIPSLIIHMAMLAWAVHYIRNRPADRTTYIIEQPALKTASAPQR